MSARINPLEAARGIAAVLVVLYHATQFAEMTGRSPLGGLFHFGFAGVDFFFVLSGFVIAHVHGKDIGQPAALGHYAWRRFARVFPPYWAATLIVLPLALFIPDFRSGTPWTAAYLVHTFLLLPMEGFPLIPPGWTLALEVFFYCLFGLLIVQRRLGASVIALWVVAILALRIWGITAPVWLNLFCLEFLLGAGVALLRIRVGTIGLAIGVLAFFSYGIFESFVGPLSSTIRFAIYGLACALIVSGLASVDWAPGRKLMTLGAASYSIYLIHYPALIGAFLVRAYTPHVPHISPIPPTLLFAAYVVVGIAAGLVFHAWVERPLLVAFQYGGLAAARPRASGPHSASDLAAR